MEHFSRYGGLWVDRADFAEKLAHRIQNGILTGDEAGQIKFFSENGYLIIPAAVSAAACDRFCNDITSAWQNGDPRLLVQQPGESVGKPLTAGSPRTGTRVVDSFVYYESALDLLLSDSVSRFLQILFEDDVLLFQSISFDMGSEQGMHQDTAYVVVGSPWNWQRAGSPWKTFRKEQES